MGFLSSLFSGSAEDEEELEEESGPALPELTLGMPLDVSIPRGRLILSGRLTQFENRTIVLERKRGQLSFELCDPGTEVFIRGFDDGAMTFDIKGVVEGSTRTRCVVGELTAVTNEDRRSSFRIVMNIPASLFYAEDKRLENAEECTLVDISATGACLQSEYIHGEGEALYLKVPFDEYFEIKENIPRTILGQVIRVEEPVAGKFRYGFLFAQMDEQETDALVRQLFSIQMGNKQDRIKAREAAWQR